MITRLPTHTHTPGPGRSPRGRTRGWADRRRGGGSRPPLPTRNGAGIALLPPPPPFSPASPRLGSRRSLSPPPPAPNNGGYIVSTAPTRKGNGDQSQPSFPPHRLPFGEGAPRKTPRSIASPDARPSFPPSIHRDARVPPGGQLQSAFRRLLLPSPLSPPPPPVGAACLFKGGREGKQAGLGPSGVQVGGAPQLSGGGKDSHPPRRSLNSPPVSPFACRFPFSPRAIWLPFGGSPGGVAGRGRRGRRGEPSDRARTRSACWKQRSALLDGSKPGLPDPTPGAERARLPSKGSLLSLSLAPPPCQTASDFLSPGKRWGGVREVVSAQLARAN